MKVKLRQVSILALCFIGAIGMFLSGVMTERRWAANRAQAGDPLPMGDLMAGAQEQDGQVSIDINELGFPEALTAGEPSRDERLPEGNETPEPPGQEAVVRDNPPDSSFQSGRTNHAPMSTEASRALFIQLGAFQSSDNAQRAVSLFDEKGLQAKVIKRNDPANGLHFKVRMGPFENTDRAVGTIKKLKQQNIPHFLVYPSG